MGMIDTLEVAIQYQQQKQIEDWIHLFLCNEGNNSGLSEGLKLEKRYYFGPIEMDLSLFKRCCGPESDMNYVVTEEGFHKRVQGIIDRMASGWKVPPLLINYDCGEFTINDGNHRYEALVKQNLHRYPVIIWITHEKDYEDFQERFLKINVITPVGEQDQ